MTENKNAYSNEQYAQQEATIQSISLLKQPSRTNM